MPLVRARIALRGHQLPTVPSETQMTDNPETLRLYAAMFEKPWHDANGGGPYPVPESSLAAARALRFYADARDEELLQERLTKKYNDAIR